MKQCKVDLTPVIVSGMASSKSVEARVFQQKIFVATDVWRDTEGRPSAPHVLGRFLSREDASRCAKSSTCGFEGDAAVREEVCDVVAYTDPETNEVLMRIVGDVVHIIHESHDEIRVRALSKLTKKEKQALGLMKD